MVVQTQNFHAATWQRSVARSHLVHWLLHILVSSAVPPSLFFIDRAKRKPDTRLSFSTTASVNVLTRRRRDVLQGVTTVVPSSLCPRWFYIAHFHATAGGLVTKTFLSTPSDPHPWNTHRGQYGMAQLFGAYRLTRWFSAVTKCHFRLPHYKHRSSLYHYQRGISCLRSDFSATTRLCAPLFSSAWLCQQSSWYGTFCPASIVSIHYLCRNDLRTY